MILGPTYKFQQAVDAINRIKAVKKTRVITFEDIIPPISKELEEKSVYMQQDEFWSNPHNKRMYQKSNNQNIK